MIIFFLKPYKNPKWRITESRDESNGSKKADLTLECEKNYRNTICIAFPAAALLLLKAIIIMINNSMSYSQSKKEKNDGAAIGYTFFINVDNQIDWIETE